MLLIYVLLIILKVECKNALYGKCVKGSTDDLIKHGLRAVRDTLPNDVELTTKVS